MRRGLAAGEYVINGELGTRWGLGAVVRVAEEDEEGGLPVGGQFKGAGDGPLAEEGGAFEVAGEAAGVGSQEEVLEGSAQALKEHVALSEAASAVGPGAGLGQGEAGQEEGRGIAELAAGAG